MRARLLISLTVLAAAGCSPPAPPASNATAAQPVAAASAPADVHSRAVVVDAHDDTTQRLFFEKSFDIGERHANGNIDVPRMREGGLDALFLSIWIPSEVTGPIAVKRAMQLIDSVHEAVRRHPNDLVLATTASDIRRATADKKIAALMGMEGGSSIGARLSRTPTCHGSRPERRVACDGRVSGTWLIASAA